MRGAFEKSGPKKEGPQVKARSAPMKASNLMQRPV
jgi:hypothetical protein